MPLAGIPKILSWIGRTDKVFLLLKLARKDWKRSPCLQMDKQQSENSSIRKSQGNVTPPQKPDKRYIIKKEISIPRELKII